MNFTGAKVALICLVLFGLFHSWADQMYDSSDWRTRRSARRLRLVANWLGVLALLFLTYSFIDV